MVMDEQPNMYFSRAYVLDTVGYGWIRTFASVWIRLDTVGYDNFGYGWIRLDTVGYGWIRLDTTFVGYVRFFGYASCWILPLDFWTT
jgi:hypothetical protein